MYQRISDSITDVKSFQVSNKPGAGCREPKKWRWLAPRGTSDGGESFSQPDSKQASQIFPLAMRWNNPDFCLRLEVKLLQEILPRSHHLGPLPLSRSPDVQFTWKLFLYVAEVHIFLVVHGSFSQSLSWPPNGYPRKASPWNPLSAPISLVRSCGIRWKLVTYAIFLVLQ
jgi:hypothetical protein